MEEWMNFPHDMMGGSGLLGWIMMLIFWAAIIGGIMLFLFLVLKSAGPTGGKNAEEILDKRYARGEIDDEEYERKKKSLKDSSE